MRAVQEELSRSPHNRGKGACLAWIRAHQDHAGEDCLLWPFSVDNQGYGFVSYYGVLKRAHYIMCLLVNGEKPSPKHQAAHSCNNGHLGCVNPRHLSWKTPQQNAQDRVRAGNYPSGDRRGRLDEDKVRQILALKGKRTITDLGEMFDVSFSAISSIYCGRTWKWVSNEVHQN